MADHEDHRAESLLAAQAKAEALFAAVADRGLVAPGAGEREVSDRVRDLANEMFGPTRHWHKRIIRSGPNTLLPYRENPPDRVIDADDIAFADFGRSSRSSRPTSGAPSCSAPTRSSSGCAMTCR
jgi:hypothetical protein